MGGRQAHGRSLMAGPKSKPGANKKSKARSQKNALDAFGIAQEKFAPKQKRTPRARELDAEIERKHGRDDEDEDEEEEEEEEPQRKKIKRPTRPADDDAEYGSDSEGNEWRLGGLREDDEDSEIESDEAFGDSDDEKFQGYSFRGSKSTHKDDDSEDDSQDDEGETLGADAIDLATALDQFEESSEEEADNKDQAGSSDSDDDASDESEEDDDDDEDDDSEDDEANPEKLDALQGLITGYGGEEEEDTGKKTKTKISLSDLGLTGIDDQNVKKSMKLLHKEEKETRPGATKKLDVPLARREQGRLDRSAAYEKTNETMDRWNETVKQNRRAEHLVFPLPQNSATYGLDTTEIQPLTAKNPSNELESAIMSIMEQSGLSLNKPEKKREKEFDDEGNELSRKEALARKRMERELISRETKRAKRIKKIKSKAYHRVHRKQRERDEMAAKEAMEEAGEVDSEAEREAQDRRRALERVGQRHKESKWAKLGSKTKRAVWDDDFRAGLTEMARRDEELRRRKEGRTGGGSDDDSTSDSDSDGGDASIRRQLKDLEEEDDEPRSKLMQMKFMQKAEAAKKEANDALIQQIKRELDGDDAEDSEEGEKEEVGRRQYGAAEGKAFVPALESSSQVSKKRRTRDEDDDDEVIITTDSNKSRPKTTLASNLGLTEATETSTLGAWSRGETRRKSKKLQSSARLEDLDLTSNVMVASRPSKSKNKAANGTTQDEDDSDASDTEMHLPMAIRDQEMVARAFAGEDVVGEFDQEKEEMAEADDDKIIDNTIPGWGSWVGDGVSSKEKKRHQGRFLTKVEGIKKKDRKDAKLDRVIINEKRVKKNDAYLASQLPHPFESRQQYERSLRLPVGPEWSTKETFQDSTKPRVLMKQGIITPMSKPMI